MPTRAEIMAFVSQLFDQGIQTADDAWVALYRLILEYVYDVPRITDSNRLKRGIWRERARQVEEVLATARQCATQEVPNHLNVFMRSLYPAGTQRMNPIGIAFACTVVYLMQRFGAGSYEWKLEAKIGVDVFPNLIDFRRRSVDIVAFTEAFRVRGFTIWRILGAFQMMINEIVAKKIFVRFNRS